MSKPVLYHVDYSPPSRFAMITAQQIGLDVEERYVDFFKAEPENLSDEFKKINPTSTVPALVDGDMNIFDSSAIGIYMVEKYAKDDSLYPKDLKLRTKVNEKLFYVSSYIFPRIYQIFVCGYHGVEFEIPQRKIDEMMRGYQTVEVFLSGGSYLAGDFMSLADLSLWTIMESITQLIPLEEEKFPKFVKWLESMRKLPTYELNKQGALGHVAFFRDCVARNKSKI